MTRATRYSVYFGVILVVFLFIFYHVDLETGEVRAPFTHPPTPTPTLIDELAKKLWVADGRPTSEHFNEERLVDRYGDLFAANAFGCKMDYTDFYDMIVEKAQEFTELYPEHDAPHSRVIGILRRKRNDRPCFEYLSDQIENYRE